MLKKVYMIVGVLILALVAITIISTQTNKTSQYNKFTSESTGVSFNYSKDWNITSDDKFITLSSEDTRILITTNPIEGQVEGLGLSTATQVLKLGANEYKVLDKEFKTPEEKEVEQKTFTFTYYYLVSAGKGFIFEVSPMQKGEMSSDLQKMLKTFTVK
jgi:hypothetical protein